MKRNHIAVTLIASALAAGGLSTGCATRSGSLQPNFDHGGAEVRAGVDFANLPQGPKEEGSLEYLIKLPFRLASDAAYEWRETFNESPWLTIAGTVAAGLTVGEIFDSRVSWTGVAERIGIIEQPKQPRPPDIIIINPPPVVAPEPTPVDPVEPTPEPTPVAP